MPLTGIRVAVQYAILHLSLCICSLIFGDMFHHLQLIWFAYRWFHPLNLNFKVKFQKIGARQKFEVNVNLTRDGLFILQVQH